MKNFLSTNIGCPICGHNKFDNILNLRSGNFDQSTLYQDIVVLTCLNCGHIFNPLSELELEGLNNYYNKEYAPSNINSKDKTGDLPGSNNTNTIGRYKKLYDFIKDKLDYEHEILDVGCSKGGFLKFLKNEGYNNLSGIDIVTDYLDGAKINLPEAKIKFGGAEQIPFTEGSFDFILMDQVMEHLINPRQAMREAARTLKDGGILCLGIPDASRYQKNYFFDFYWFLLREHLQHFDLTHISLLAESCGFELLDYLKDDSIMMSEKMVLPNLNLMLKLNHKSKIANELPDKFELINKIDSYINENLEKLNTRKSLFEQLAKEKKSIYVWGMSREFFYLYETAGLKKCHISGLIDTNPFKQNQLTVDGMKVGSEDILTNSNEADYLLITATAHDKAISQTVKEKGYKLKLIEL